MSTTELDIRSLAKKAAGNHYGFTSFAWFHRPRDDENWTIQVTRHRDSGLVELSNHVVISKALDRFDEGRNPTVIWQDHSHWAVGWVTAAVIRVYTSRGRITKAFRVWCELQSRLQDCPILNESDFHQREHDAAIAAIEQEGRQLVPKRASKGWPAQVHGWLEENREWELQNVDDQGASPSRESIREALRDLRLLQPPVD